MRARKSPKAGPHTATLPDAEFARALRELRDTATAFRTVAARSPTPWQDHLAVLPVLQRNTLIVVCLEGLAITRVAELLGVPPYSVVSTLTTAMGTMISVLTGTAPPEPLPGP